MSVFPAVRIEGGLLGPDILEQLMAGDLPGQKPRDFGLDPNRKLTDEIATVFAEARAQWEAFRRRLERLPEGDVGTSITRDAWMIPFLSVLGYELCYNPRAYEIDGLTFAISHRAGEVEDAPPVHIVGVRQDLGRLAPTGRPRLAPHSLVQEYLNRSEQLWGIVTNGLTLRLLRDSTYVRRQAYVEFDLAQIFEEQRFHDFQVLYRLLHRSRLPRSADEAKDCLLEQYYRHGLEQGGRVREHLREGVERCIERLANGFLAHPENQELRQRVVGKASGESRVASGEGPTLSPEELYHQLLRLVYRLLFLLVSEDRGLISSERLYREHYGVARLRRLLDRRSAYTEHDDIWCSLRVLWRVFGDETLAAVLGAPPLNGELFARQPLDDYTISNRDFLEAFWHLAYYRESQSAPPRRVNYAALDVEELGSVYESLLDYHPQVDSSGPLPRFELAFGSERKSTGSYYTPPELVAELVHSALDPVIEERLQEIERAAEEAKRVASGEWRVVHQSIQKIGGAAYADSIVSRLGSVAKRHGLGRTHLPHHEPIPQGGTLRPDQPTAPRGDFHPGQHRRGLGAPGHEGIPPVSEHRGGEPSGSGNTGRPGVPNPSDPGSGGHVATPAHPSPQPPDAQSPAFTPAEIAALWPALPLATRHSLLADAFAEHALLSVRILDPACGSGHFLLAAARRLGKELATIRTGEDEPAPERVREAIRDVVAHCIYGVDKNPLAVELCRVALWLEAHCEGKPLTFLDHRIRCGDSLVGVTDLEVLENGIPDQAFEPTSGDEKAVVSRLKKRNRNERRALEDGQLPLPLRFGQVLPRLAELGESLARIPDDSPAAVRRKKSVYEQSRSDPQRRRLEEACNLWTAAFFQRMANEAGGTDSAITTRTVLDHLAGRPDPRAVARAEALASAHRFFHWPLEFPEVFSPNSECRMANREGAGESRIGTGGQDPLAARHSPLAGFDVVLGNPPWEQVQFSEQEFFETRAPEIAAAAGAKRKALIDALQQSNPVLYRAFLEAHHLTTATRRFLVSSGEYPLTGRGKINTYSVFAERMRRLIRAGGRAGIIVPTGIATDDTNKFFFADLVERGELVSLFDFENRNGIFPEVHRSYKFSLLTLRRAVDHARPSSPPFAIRHSPFAPDDPLATRHSPLAPNDPFAVPHSPLAEFAFFCHEASDLADPERRFTLTPEDFRLLNPNTRTAPIFRSRRDAELTKHIYRRVPVLVDETSSEQRAASGQSREPARRSPLAARDLPSNPWGVEFMQGLFNMTSDSGLFRTREELEEAGFRLEGNVFVKGDPHSPLATRYSPLYEAKMVHQFDHRWATYRGQRMANGEWRVETANVAGQEKADPECLALPRYWVPEAEVEARLRAKGWDRGWLLGWRDIARSTDERTVIAAVIPRLAVGDKYLLMLPSPPEQAVLLVATLDALAFDYCARQKVGGTSLKYFTMKQLPVLPPDAFDRPLPFAWQSDHSPLTTRHSRPTVADFIRPRVLELTYTAWDLAPFARDLWEGADAVGQQAILRQWEENMARREASSELPVGTTMKGHHSPLATRHSPLPPFRYDPERRAQLRAELDALFFLLYLGTPEEWEREATPELKALFPTPRHAVEYILDQFPIVRRKDEERFGEYRTKRLILEIYEAMAAATKGRPAVAGERKREGDP